MKIIKWFLCSEEGAELKNVKQILDELDIFDYTLTDCMIMREICQAVSSRAAYLSAAGINEIVFSLLHWESNHFNVKHCFIHQERDQGCLDLRRFKCEFCAHWTKLGKGVPCNKIINILYISLQYCLMYFKLLQSCCLVFWYQVYQWTLGVAALLKRVSRTSVTVAVDGSLYRYHPKFHDLMTDMTQQLLPHKQVRLVAKKFNISHVILCLIVSIAFLSFRIPTCDKFLSKSHKWIVLSLHVRGQLPIPNTLHLLEDSFFVESRTNDIIGRTLVELIRGHCPPRISLNSIY